jgi:hypothetical protein
MTPKISSGIKKQEKMGRKREAPPFWGSREKN